MTQTNGKIYHSSELEELILLNDHATQGNIQIQCNCYQNTNGGASLVAQWLRICLPMQGTRVRALVWEDPTCHGATKPMSHNY